MPHPIKFVIAAATATLVLIWMVFVYRPVLSGIPDILYSKVHSHRSITPEGLVRYLKARISQYLYEEARAAARAPDRK
jgi:hypothetical protein